MLGGTLERVIDWVEDFIGLFKCWAILDEYERGIRLTWGIRRDWLGRKPELGPGFHFIIPFGVEEVLVDNIVPRPETLNTLTLTTEDGKTVAITPVVSWSIVDMVKFTLEVEDGENIFDLAVDAQIAQAVAEAELEFIYAEDFWLEVRKASRRICKRYGVRLEELSYSELYETEVASTRLLGGIDLGDPFGVNDDEE